MKRDGGVACCKRWPFVIVARSVAVHPARPAGCCDASRGRDRLPGGRRPGGVSAVSKAVARRKQRVPGSWDDRCFMGKGDATVPSLP